MSLSLSLARGAQKYLNDSLLLFKRLLIIFLLSIVRFSLFLIQSSSSIIRQVFWSAWTETQLVSSPHELVVLLLWTNKVCGLSCLQALDERRVRF